MKTSLRVAAALVLAAGLAACGQSAEQAERERQAHDAELRKAIADSLAEEHEKDRRMREAAAADAAERIAREDRERDAGLAKAAATDAAVARLQLAAEQQRAQDDAMIRQHLDRLRQSLRDPDAVEIRNAQISPRRNGVCAEFAAKDKAARVSGIKRVIVTDTRVAVEEPPVRETLALYLLFQLAARDTGCFPDTQQVRILQ